MKSLLVLLMVGLFLGLPGSARPENPGAIVDGAGHAQLNPRYGDTAEFWESHTLVIVKVEAARIEDDRKSLLAHELLSVQIEESIPDRLAVGERLDWTFPRFIIARDRPQEILPMFKPGDRLMALAVEIEGRIVLEDREFEAEEFILEEHGPLEFMPGGSDVYTITKDDDPLVVETKQVCRAISTVDVQQRLKLIAAILEESPGERVKTVLRHSLQEAADRTKATLERVEHLLKEAEGQ